MLYGATNAEKIWNYFKSVGMSEYGIAGLIGNLDCESALNPKNLQDSFEAVSGFADESYTAAVDDGSYKNFVYDNAGYGLFQATWWSRKKALLDYAKECGTSIGDLEMQIRFIHKELKNSYHSVYSTLMSATSIKEASNAVLLKYECPCDTSVKVQEIRFAYAQKYYARFSKNTGTGGVNNMGYINVAKKSGMKLSEHFNSNEFDCHGSGCCSTTIINEKLVEYLEKIREHFKKPITITSAYRCVTHNRNVGGATGSRHSKGDAADIVVSGVAPAEVARFAESIGIKGIGLYETSADGHFVHIDTRDQNKKMRVLGFDFHVTKTGKVIMQIDPKNVKDRRKNIYRCAQLVHKGEMTREKADEMFRAWLNHASKGDNPKMIKRMHEYYQQCMEG